MRLNPQGFLYRNRDLIKRVLFTIAVLLFIRLGSYLTVPGIKVNKNFSNQSASQFFTLLSLLGGGTLGKFSVLALGVSPYITASIIVQLLSTDIIPPLARWAKSGAKGRRKLERLTKIITIPFALVQGIAIIFTLISQKAITPKWSDASLGSGPSWFYYLLVPLCLLAGTMFMLWLGDQISLRGVGNGLSLIIFGGIVARLPFSMKETFNFWILIKNAASVLLVGILKFSLYIVVFLLMIMFVVFFNESERRIPIEHTGSGLRSGSASHSKDSFLPLRINSAGVIPVIFSSALISAPITISQIIKASQPNSDYVRFVNQYLLFSTWTGIALYGVLTILFTFMYAQVQINPEKVAQNFQKSGTFIPGIKPGLATERYVSGVVNRLSWLGSVTLALIAVCPYIVSKTTKLPQSLAIGGTGLIIMVSVALQTTRQIQGRYIQQQFIHRKQMYVAQQDHTYLW